MNLSGVAQKEITQAVDKAVINDDSQTKGPGIAHHVLSIYSLQHS